VVPSRKVPGVGRFTTTDPLPGLPGAPTIANPYDYAENDPTNRTDPTGMRPTDEDFDTYRDHCTLGEGFAVLIDLCAEAPLPTLPGSLCDPPSTPGGHLIEVTPSGACAIQVPPSSSVDFAAPWEHLLPSGVCLGGFAALVVGASGSACFYWMSEGEFGIGFGKAGRPHAA
jgi:hypothetical protein